MFSKDVIDTDMFLEMPISTQLLYFHLALRADDDGFVSSPKRILRLIGCSEDDLKILLSKEYLIPFDTGVCVIRHWRVHNYIRSDRYKGTMYSEEKEQLTKNRNNEYELKDPDAETVEKIVGRPDVIPSVIPDVIPKVSTGKVSIGKDNTLLYECPELELASSDESDSAVHEEIVYSLPKLGGGMYDITKKQYDMFVDAYPALDIMAEFKLMNTWLVTNPKNQKKNMPRFINNWLSRSQDKARRVGNPSQATPVVADRPRSVLDEERV
jgi:hypothetical protein